MRFIAFFFLFIFSLSAMETITIKEGETKKLEGVIKSCHLRLSFGSYGSGTPHKVIKTIREYIDKNKGDIKSNTTWSWGLEGEFDYCLVLEDKGNTEKHFAALKELIPLFSKEGYTVLKDFSGKTHKTNWPKN